MRAGAVTVLSFEEITERAKAAGRDTSLHERTLVLLRETDGEPSLEERCLWASLPLGERLRLLLRLLGASEAS